MSSLVLDLQSEILNKECDLLIALRKAHLIAQKLDLQEFDKWINFELNGYSECSQKDIPSYREIKGELKAWNPYNGWIPVSFQDSKIENMLNTYRMNTSIGDLINLYNSATESNTIVMSIGADIENYLNQYNDAPYRPKYSLQFGKYLLSAIVEKVKNCLLDWTINLENKGVLGENMQFDEREKTVAKTLPQQINNYYGPVVQGNVQNSQVVTGDNNEIKYNKDEIKNNISKIRNSIGDSDEMTKDDKETAIEILQDISDKVEQNKKQSIIKAALSGLKDFVISAGGQVVGTLIAATIQGL